LLVIADREMGSFCEIVDNREKLQNEFIESGRPSFVVGSSPSEEEQACEVHFFEVCSAGIEERASL
jgi:hypothetical protein